MESLHASQLIKKEREEQIHKHGYTSASDDKHTECELLSASYAITMNIQFAWPRAWDINIFKKIMQKSRKEQLVIAAAFCKAEESRLERMIDSIITNEHIEAE
ncbi:MAG: hypothetical protein ACK4EY_14530 [Flavipsychrobacter sp.]